jgi:hypothetical protein
MYLSPRLRGGSGGAKGGLRGVQGGGGHLAADVGGRAAPEFVAERLAHRPQDVPHRGPPVRPHDTQAPASMSNQCSLNVP